MTPYTIALHVFAAIGLLVTGAAALLVALVILNSFSFSHGPTAFNGWKAILTLRLDHGARVSVGWGYDDHHPFSWRPRQCRRRFGWGGFVQWAGFVAGWQWQNAEQRRAEVTAFNAWNPLWMYDCPPPEGFREKEEARIAMWKEERRAGEPDHPRNPGIVGAFEDAKKEHRGFTNYVTFGDSKTKREPR